MNKINLNNLLYIKEDLKTLKASEETIKQVEENIRKGVPSFEVIESKSLLNGQVDIHFPIKTSDPEKGYFFSNFTAKFQAVKPLEEGQFYFLITPKANGVNDTKKFTHPLLAVEQFKKREDKNCKLVVGKDVKNTKTVAERIGTDVVVGREYGQLFYGKPTEQTFYHQEGKGFTVEQAGNLIQGRSVYRNDLVSKQGEPYKAWLNLDFEAGKSGRNFQLKTRRDPNYGFDLTESLKDYNIKFLKNSENQPKNMDELETALRNGNKPLVLVNKNGVETELQLETAVRFRKMNFFSKDGMPELREQFLTKEAQAKVPIKTTNKENNQSVEQGLER